MKCTYSCEFNEREAARLRTINEELIKKLRELSPPGRCVRCEHDVPEKGRTICDQCSVAIQRGQTTPLNQEKILP